MGIDLTLIPLRRGMTSAPTLLDLLRRSDLYEAVLTLSSTPISEIPTVSENGLKTYLAKGETGESVYGAITVDEYGDPLRAVAVRDLEALREHPGVTDNDDNRAAWAYLGALPDTYNIVLFWY